MFRFSQFLEDSPHDPLHIGSVLTQGDGELRLFTEARHVDQGVEIVDFLFSKFDPLAALSCLFHYFFLTLSRTGWRGSWLVRSCPALVASRERGEGRGCRAKCHRLP